MKIEDLVICYRLEKLYGKIISFLQENIVMRNEINDLYQQIEENFKKFEY
jgi:hypothetical protein